MITSTITKKIKHSKYIQSVYGRLSILLFLSVLVVAIFSSFIFVGLSQRYQQEITQNIHSDLAKHIVKEHLLFKNDKPDYAAAEKLFSNLMVLGPNFEFYILSKSGQVLACSGEPDKVKIANINTKDIIKFIELGEEKELILGDDPRSTERKKIFSAAEITNNNQEVIGYVYVILASQIYDRTVSTVLGSKNLQLGLLLTLKLLAMTFIAVIGIARIITHPLCNLTTEVKKIEEIGFDKRPTQKDLPLLKTNKSTPDSANEIEILTHSFNKLLSKLNSQYKNIVTIDELRKELISHVSHDLRTPLASLLGYLETWQMTKEHSTKEESSKYIETAQRNAEKISMLIEQLFELAHLDSGNVKVKLEKFSIAELVQDVLQKFQIIANKKNISLAVTPQDSSIEVVGDIEKLERVFTNLIENALRHTNENGSIIVRLKHEARSVAIEVSDTGIGIPAQDVEHIFTPHFKAENSVRGDTAHGGLGLAITKKLLSLHQANIQVRSIEKKGTTFLFKLATA